MHTHASLLSLEPVPVKRPSGMTGPAADLFPANLVCFERKGVFRAFRIRATVVSALGFGVASRSTN
jgi:hypothetical protein